VGNPVGRGNGMSAGPPSAPVGNPKLVGIENGGGV
jgi:hypothetical protein